jgi:hypothetical protein
MSVWNFEAADIRDVDDLLSTPIYHTPAIDEFLAQDRSQQRILSGLKGTGKTLFLKLVSQRYRQGGGVTCVPATELTEKLYSIDHDFSSDTARYWSSHEVWMYVWRTVLAVVALKASKQELPRSISEMFPDSLELSVAAHLSVAMRTRAAHWHESQVAFSGILATKGDPPALPGRQQKFDIF